ncbi:MAG: LptF/LptG family permease, partial [Spirochaetota bacterium]|nr:LptF/LptG family permease [Spirochaetota bacterium]
MAILEDEIFTSMGSKTVWVEKVDKQKNRLNNILIYNKNESGGWDVIKAESGAWKQNEDGSKILHLFKGRLFSNEIKNDTYSIVDFSNGDAEIMITEGRIDYNENKRKPNPTEMNSIELYNIINNSGKSYKEDRDIARYMVELYKKYAIPFSCLVFSIIGTPIGMFSKRSGRGIGFGLSIIVFFVYYIFFMSGQSLAIRGMIHPFMGVWGSN